MAKFELHYSHGIYGERIVFDVEIPTRIDKDSYQKLLDAIEIIDEVKKKYLSNKGEK